MTTAVLRAAVPLTRPEISSRVVTVTGDQRMLTTTVPDRTTELDRTARSSV